MIRLATDVGGTFTDLVAWNEATDELSVAKDLTTPADQSDGVMSVVGLGALDHAAVAEFVHGGTTVINAITERKGVRTALITTKGFRDVLAIGRGNRPDLYNLQFQVPEPFVPRKWRFEAVERMDADGEVVLALDPLSIEHIAETCRKDGIEAIAVCFLHSYRNPAHERECGEILADLVPDISVTLSSEFTREWREFERTSTAVLNAYVQPIIQRYFDRLSVRLKDAGITAPLQAMQSNGGTTSFASARAHPLTLVESGPAAGVNGAVVVGRAANMPDMIAFDVGGTTAKCSLIRGGMATVNTDYWIEKTPLHPGYPVKAPVIDIVEVGAGGGSIARIDAAGRLKVGPQSAGADPGPACYGVGGTEPTVTDAMLLTGILDVSRFSDGRIALSKDKASKAFKPIADALSLDIVPAAAAVIRLAEANMINALKLISVQRGHDPRDFAMLAYGGGGAMHAASLARELGMKKVVIPRYPGLFSAWGMLATSPRHDQVRTEPLDADAISADDLHGIFRAMTQEARSYFDGTADGELSFTARLEMRYHGQEHTVAVSVDPVAIQLEQLIEAFHEAHKRAYTFRLEDTRVEIIHFHLASEQKRRVPDIRPVGTQGRSLKASTLDRRDIHFGEDGIHEAVILDRAGLPVGEQIAGPAIIVEPTSTTKVLPDQSLHMDELGLIHIIDER
ncbi:hydantoinase/oxoprolinase family protein [Minwuia sp.]|uniref:hydantoinase/oxoprolinase family protein n=1 Tax=Minwuia sp. TaxID=2493630 RepID=UPI003A949CA8